MTDMSKIGLLGCLKHKKTFGGRAAPGLAALGELIAFFLPGFQRLQGHGGEGKRRDRSLAKMSGI